MKKLVLSCVIFLFITPLPLLASDASTLSKKSESTYNYEIAPYLLGFSSSAATKGINVGYKLTDKVLVEFSYLGGQQTTNYGGSSMSITDFNNKVSYSVKNEIVTKSEAISLGAKYFTGSTFYLRPVLKYVSTSMTGETSIDHFSAEGKFIMAELGIGNQWNMGNFTIGCDWLAISGRLTSLKNELRSGKNVGPPIEILERLGNPQKDPKFDYLEEWESLSTIDVSLLRFYLGIVF